MSRPAGRLTHGPVVELVGIPGAGKSRLTRALVDDLSVCGVPVHTPQARLGPAVPVARRLSRKAGSCVHGAVARPLVTARVTAGLVRSGQPRPADLAGRLVQWLVADALTGTGRRRRGVTVLDEGPVQALWSTGLRGDVTPLLAALERRAPTAGADVLVVVRVPADVALARLAARPSQHSRTQRLPAADRLAELERGAALLDRLVEWWSGAAAGRSVVVVGGTDDVVARARLVERLTEATTDSAPQPSTPSPSSTSAPVRPDRRTTPGRS